MSREQGMADISPKEVSQPESGKSNPSREEHILHPKLSGPMRAAVVGSIAAGLAGGCLPPNGNTETPESTNTPPTVEFSPTPTGPNQTPTPFEMYTDTVTSTETQTQEPTKTETATPTITEAPTEKPRFEQLIWPTIEECMKNNEIHWDTLDADLGVLKAKAEAVMSPDPSVYGEYTAHIFDSVPGHMSVLQLIIPNPQIGYCAYLNHEGHEFLILEVYIKSRVGDYSEPIPFAIDLSLNRQMPDYVYKSIFDNYMSLFNNDEKNYKKLINNEAKTLEIHVAYVVGQADNNSIHNNILWLYQSEEAMFNNFLDFWYIGRYPAYMNGLNEKDKSTFTNALRVTATHLLPVSDIAVDHSVY